MKYKYVFLERWVLSASPKQVYAALADFDLYARWGHPAYVSGRRNGPVAVGCAGEVVAQGSLPYNACMNFVIRRLEPAREILIGVTGDLLGEAHWNFRPMGEGTELMLDWRCDPNWKLIRALTPMLEPLFRWNHSECMNTAIAGLAKYLHLESERALAAEPRKTSKAKGRRPVSLRS